MTSSVGFYFTKPGRWQAELYALREILQQCPLTEVLKWGVPTYTFEDTNLVLIHQFKAYCAVLFFQGALLPDPQRLLVQQTENVQAARQMRFTSIEAIEAQADTLKAYVHQAIALEKAGQKVPLKRTEAFEMPDEFRRQLDAMPQLDAAFNALTPGRQRAYLLHFAAAKLPQTREARVDKSIPRILQGKGLDD